MITKIENMSETRRVEISLGQTEPKTTGVPEGKIIEPKSEIDIPKTFEGGCAKMFIWDMEGNKTKDLLWCGIIPLSSSVVKIFPEEKKVSVDDGVIPQCSDISTKGKMTIEGFMGETQNKKPPTWWWILLLLTILLGAYLGKNFLGF